MVVWTLLGAPNNQFYLKHDPLEMLERDIHIHGLKYRGVGFLRTLAYRVWFTWLYRREKCFYFGSHVI